MKAYNPSNTVQPPVVAHMVPARVCSSGDLSWHRPTAPYSSPSFEGVSLPTLWQGFVEDTKGNNGEQGELTITNLRVLWISQRSRRMNLSLGYNAIVSINIRQAASRLRGVPCMLPSHATKWV